MKTQQRTFIVERKSGRRRLTTQPASIWGDTDFKSLVRKAEADAPHLFEPGVVSETPPQDSEQPAAAAPETCLGENTETGEGQQSSASSVEADKLHPPQGDDLAFSAVPQSNDAFSGEPLPRVAKRSRKASVRLQGVDTRSIASVRSTAKQVETAADELVALDDENRRLKRLLAHHLRRQNMQLRTMLVRFGAI